MTSSTLIELVEKALEWVSKNKNRCVVEIEIGGQDTKDHRSVWVYDYDFTHGKHVYKPSDFDAFYDSYITKKENEIKNIECKIARFKGVPEGADSSIDGSVF